MVLCPWWWNLCWSQPSTAHCWTSNSKWIHWIRYAPIGDETQIEKVFHVFSRSFQRCDQRIGVNARPLHITYDAETIIQLLQVFKMPQNTNLSELTDAAADKLSNFKERSATGIQYMIEKHTRLEVDINVMPNLLIIPHGGTYLEWVWRIQPSISSRTNISLCSVFR